MTYSEAVTKASKLIAQHVENYLESGEIMLRDHGATDEEVATFMTHQRQQMEAWAEETMGEIRRSLLEWGAPSAKLQ